MRNSLAAIVGFALVFPLVFSLGGGCNTSPRLPLSAMAQDPPVPEPQPEPDPPQPAPTEPFVTLPAEITGEPGAFIAVRPTTNGKQVRYLATTPGLNVFPADMLRDPTATVVTAQTGRYQLVAYTAIGDVPSEPAVVSIVVGAAPPPVPPNPPTPPNPPAPLPTSGLRVLVIEQNDARDELPRDKQRVLESIRVGELRDYLDSVCAKVGATAEWRIVDQGDSLQFESPIWQQAREVARPAGLPWVLVSNGTSGEQAPLPSTEAEFKALVAKYAGK